MKKLFLIISIVIIGASCQEIPEVQKPESFIEQPVMEEILYESILINAAQGYNIAKLKLIGLKPDTYVYDKFDIDSATYAQNVAYYTTDIDAYREMNAKVLDRIKAQLAVDDSIETAERKLKDSLRTARAKELQKEKQSERTIEGNSGLPTRTVTDSFARRYRKQN
ncbi:DUF4296 domain-containing protein [Dokdonia genika]|uniref:DUF4296 domain-containing protein n=1 Tax=Dokdonia genika TaxID=308113 RepID=A0ABV9L9B3_9FLAO|nr:DUF4296 domain-containing protein [Dokdonia sp. MED134]